MIIAFFVISLFGFVIFALREGWIPAHSVPWLVDAFKKVGMGDLIEKPVDLTPKPRFARPSPRPAAAPRPAGAQRPAPGPAPKPAAQTWDAYYKAHPEYAKKIREYYRSAYHRRYA